MTTTGLPRESARSMTSDAIARPRDADVDLAAAIAQACNRMAPSWPLDRLIAVNPAWGFVNAPIEMAASELAALSGATLLMPRAWYREQLDTERVDERHIARAIAIA